MTLARALIYGNKQHPDLEGVVFFNQGESGVWVMADITGLPEGEGPCGGAFFGFHIHTGDACTGTEEEPFANVNGHYNPDGCDHPYHRGDMPPLIGSDGDAYLSFLTNRITVAEIIGKTVIIHGNPDDFHTQPSGNVGPMIACGVIEET